MTTPDTADTADLQAGVDGDLSHLFDLGNPHLDVQAAFTTVQARHDLYNNLYLGFPVSALDLPHSRQLAARQFFNHIGTTDHWPLGYQHAMEAETAVLGWVADLVRIPAGRRWGHITTGGSAGNLAGIRHARHRYPDAVLLHSSTAHYSVARAAADLRIETIRVPALAGEQMDLDALDATIGRLVARRPPGDLALIVVATLGTTRTEASDDLPGITTILDTHKIRRRHIHVDAALAGIPLALDGLLTLEPADSLAVSAYKFLGVPEACGIVLGHRPETSADEHVTYTGTVNTTGVRSGLPALMMFESIAQLGDRGHRERAHTSRELADYTIEALTRLGVQAWRHPGAYFTVVLASPPDAVLQKWVLGPNGHGHHRIVLVPGRTRRQVDHFLTDLAAALATTSPVPAQRSNPFAAFSSHQAPR